MEAEIAEIERAQPPEEKSRMGLDEQARRRIAAGRREVAEIAGLKAGR